MAYVNNEDELKQGGAGGQVLAGSGGAAGAAKEPQAVGSGFTNLQTYLSANKGQGGGVADAITEQGQQAVNAERAKADTVANTWADNGVKQATQAGDNAADPYNTAAGALQADPNAGISNPHGSTYGGPQTAQDVQGYNDLETAYQNVKNTATNFQGDRMTQQAGLQKKFGYGSGFAALDGLLGRQDGGDKINSWAQGVNSGSADAQVAKVNTAIAGGKQEVADARTGFQKANTDAKTARTAANRAAQPAPTGWGGQGIASVTNDPWEDDMDDQNTTGGFR
jgi:hypothetical protein